MDKYLESKTGFWWLLFKEVFYMFSNKHSTLSSKRCERFVMFNIAMWSIVFFIRQNFGSITTVELCSIISILLFGSGWNAIQIRKDQTLKKENDEKVTD